MKNTEKKIKSLFIRGVMILVAAVFAACSSDSGAPSISLSGIAADGYLWKARVFLDCNENFNLDADEEVVFTDNNGRFTFPESLADDVKNCPVVVDANDIETVVDTDDRDTNGTPQTLKDAGREGFKISAPAGKYQFISPLTTVAHVIDEDAYSNELKQVLKITDDHLTKLGITSMADLLHLDYLNEEGLSDEAKAVLGEVKKRAQVLARIMETKQTPMNTEMNLCIGKKCPQLIEESLAYFSNIYEKMETEGKFGVHGPEVSYDDMHGIIDQASQGATAADFTVDHEGEDVHAQDLLPVSVLKPATIDPCTANGAGNSDHQFIVSAVQEGQLAAMIFSANVLYSSYTNSISNNNTPQGCEEFFAKRSVNRENTMINFIAYEAPASSLDESKSVLYMPTNDIGPTATSYTLTRLYVDYGCAVGSDDPLSCLKPAEPLKSATIDFDAGEIKFTVTFTTVSTTGVVSDIKEYIPMARMSEALTAVLSGMLAMSGGGGHNMPPDGSGH